MPKKNNIDKENIILLPVDSGLSGRLRSGLGLLKLTFRAAEIQLG
jgi:hypothetical protein